MSLFELICDFFSWVNEFFKDQDQDQTAIIFNLVENPETPENLAEQLKTGNSMTIKGNVITREDLDLMKKHGEEIKAKTDVIYEDYKRNKLPRKVFLKNLMLLYKSYGFSDGYIRHVCTVFYPYLKDY